MQILRERARAPTGEKVRNALQEEGRPCISSRWQRGNALTPVSSSVSLAATTMDTFPIETHFTLGTKHSGIGLHCKERILCERA